MWSNCTRSIQALSSLLLNMNTRATKRNGRHTTRVEPYYCICKHSQDGVVRCRHAFARCCWSRLVGWAGSSARTPRGLRACTLNPYARSASGTLSTISLNRCPNWEKRLDGLLLYSYLKGGLMLLHRKIENGFVISQVWHIAAKTVWPNS